MRVIILNLFRVFISMTVFIAVVFSYFFLQASFASSPNDPPNYIVLLEKILGEEPLTKEHTGKVMKSRETENVAWSDIVTKPANDTRCKQNYYQ